MKEFNSVEEVIEAVRGGKIVVVMDDEDRENEGVSSVRLNLQHLRMSTLWHLMQKA